MAEADIDAMAATAEGTRALTLMMRDGITAPEDQRVAELTRAIAVAPATFLVAHETYHALGNRCPMPVTQSARGLTASLKDLDLSPQLFCKGSIELHEYRADECGLSAVSQALASTGELSDPDRRFAAQAAGALATWLFLGHFTSNGTGTLAVTPPFGYLRAPFRALAFNALVNPADGRACGESAKLIVTAVQREIQRCEAAKLPLGYDVPDLVLDLLPPKVGPAWAHEQPWEESTFACDAPQPGP